MNSISIVLSVFAAVLVTVCHGQQSSPRTWPIASYISAYERNEYEVPAFDWIKTILEEKNLSQPGEILAFFKETSLDITKNHRSSVEYNGEYITVEFNVDELIRLADDEVKLDGNIINNYIKLVQHVFGSVEVMGQSSPPSHHVGLFNYMRFYGIQKFTSSLNNLKGHYEELSSKFKGSDELAFDYFVSSHDDKKTTSSDDKYLAQLATNIDLVGGQFNAKKLLKAAKRANPRRLGSNESIAYDGLSEMCHAILPRFYSVLDVFNMVRLMSPESLSGVDLSDRLIKYNEYIRICTQRSDENSKPKVRENIRKGLEGSLSKLVKKVVHGN